MARGGRCMHALEWDVSGPERLQGGTWPWGEELWP